MDAALAYIEGVDKPIVSTPSPGLYTAKLEINDAITTIPLNSLINAQDKQHLQETLKTVNNLCDTLSSENINKVYLTNYNKSKSNTKGENPCTQFVNPGK